MRLNGLLMALVLALLCLLIGFQTDVASATTIMPDFLTWRRTLQQWFIARTQANSVVSTVSLTTIASIALFAALGVTTYTAVILTQEASQLALPAAPPVAAQAPRPRPLLEAIIGAPMYESLTLLKGLLALGASNRKSRKNISSAFSQRSATPSLPKGSSTSTKNSEPASCESSLGTSRSSEQPSSA